MAAKTKLLGKAGDGVLVAGETPLAVVRAMKPGNIKKTAVAGGIGGLLGAAVANRMDKGSPEAGFVELARMVLALTDQRLLVFTQSQMTGKAKALHAELPLASVTDVEVGEGKVLGMKIVPRAPKWRHA